MGGGGGVDDKISYPLTAPCRCHENCLKAPYLLCNVMFDWIGDPLGIGAKSGVSSTGSNGAGAGASGAGAGASVAGAGPSSSSSASSRRAGTRADSLSEVPSPSASGIPGTPSSTGSGT